MRLETETTHMLNRHLLPLLLLILAAVSACSRQTEEPRVVGEWRDIGANSAMHIYVSSAVETGTDAASPLVGLTTLWDFNQPQKRDEGVYQSVVFMFLIDCERMTGSDFSYANYSGNMAKGTVVAAGERDLKEAMRELKPITLPAVKAVADYICDIKKAGRFKKP